MKRFIVLAQSEVTARACEAWLDLAGIEIEPQNRIVHTTRFGRGDAGVGDYKSLVDQIECAIADNGCGQTPDTTILVDSIHPDYFNVVEESGAWENLVAMLLLTFPEVRWLFGLNYPTRSPLFKDHHQLSELFSGIFRETLLDPTGLREWVRIKTNEAMETNNCDDLKLPLRSDNRIAAAIDDESYFAYFNAYTAYRFGCRAEVITSWQEMKRIFGQDNNDDNPPIATKQHLYWLLLEDMSLNFPDRSANKHLLNLERDENNKQGRAYHCPRLNSLNSTIEKSNYRILVTGQTRPGDHTLTENRQYLRHKVHGRGKVVFKPVSGMFDLWGQIGLLRKKFENRRAGNVEGFNWPLDKPGKNQNRKQGTSHGAPGKLLLVAETLIHRAEAMLVDDITSMERAILGAVLTTDALELTGGRTPTTAIEALSLKHRFEVMMECMFLGNEYNIHVEERFQEIEFDLKRITIWAHRRMRRLTAMNAKMSIIVRIMRIFREYGQFDEEQLCLKHTRTLNRRLFFAKHPGLSFLHPLRWYIDKLIGSISLLVSAIVVWPVLLGGLMALLGTSWEKSETWTFIDHVTNAFYMFIAQTPAGFPQGFWAHIFTFGVSLIGIIHFGVFIAYLYNLFYRR